MRQNFHIGIMGNLFSGKTTLMQALARDPYKTDLESAARRRRAARLLGAGRQGLAHRRVPGAVLPRPRRQHLRHRGGVPAHAHAAAARDPPPDDARERAGRDHRRGPPVHRRPRGVRQAHDRVRRDAAGARQAVPHAVPPDAAQRAHPAAGPHGLSAHRAGAARAAAREAGRRRRRLRRDDHGGLPARDPRQLRSGRRQLEAHARSATRSTPSSRPTPTCSRCRPRSTWSSIPTTCTSRRGRSARRSAA